MLTQSKLDTCSSVFQALHPYIHVRIITFHGAVFIYMSLLSTYCSNRIQSQNNLSNVNVVAIVEICSNVKKVLRCRSRRPIYNYLDLTVLIFKRSHKRASTRNKPNK